MNVKYPRTQGPICRADKYDCASRDAYGSCDCLSRTKRKCPFYKSVLEYSKEEIENYHKMWTEERLNEEYDRVIRAGIQPNKKANIQ